MPLAESFYYVNYRSSNSSNYLSNENINTCVSVVFKTKCELKCQNELFLNYNLYKYNCMETPLLRLFDGFFNVITDDL